MVYIFVAVTELLQLKKRTMFSFRGIETVYSTVAPSPQIANKSNLSIMAF